MIWLLQGDGETAKLRHHAGRWSFWREDREWWTIAHNVPGGTTIDDIRRWCSSRGWTPTPQCPRRKR